MVKAGAGTVESFGGVIILSEMNVVKGFRQYYCLDLIGTEDLREKMRSK